MSGFLLFLLILLALSHCKLVTAVIIGILRVSLYPVQLDLMLFTKREKLVPEIRVEGWAGLSLPVVFLPRFRPTLVECINDVFGIRIEINFAGFFQQLKGFNHPRKLHSVVGGLWFTAGELARVLSI